MSKYRKKPVEVEAIQVVKDDNCSWAENTDDLDLKPCPFCGDRAQELKRDGKPTGIAAHCCYVLGIEVRCSVTAWNARV